MKRKNYLLPYPCQIVGWGLLGASVLFLLMYMTGCIERIEPENNNGYMYLMLNLLFFPGIFLISLSEEKGEDEMTHELRASSIAITAYVMMVLLVIIQVIDAFDFAFTFFNPSDMRFYTVQHITSNVIFGFFIYMVIFKARVWKSCWEARKELKEA